MGVGKGTPNKHDLAQHKRPRRPRVGAGGASRPRPHGTINGHRVWARWAVRADPGQGGGKTGGNGHSDVGDEWRPDTTVRRDRIARVFNIRAQDAPISRPRGSGGSIRQGISTRSWIQAGAGLRGEPAWPPAGLSVILPKAGRPLGFLRSDPPTPRKNQADQGRKNSLHVL